MPDDKDPATVIPISDSVLLSRHVRGDRSAFRELMKLYAAPIYGYLTRAGLFGAERDDLFQEIFEKIHRAAQRQVPEGELRPWVFSIAVNTVRSHYRKDKVRSVVTLDSEEGESTAAKGPSPERGDPARRSGRSAEAGGGRGG
ncbi:MAG: RNA polymerase sigma factor [Myxococcota bacterium]